MAPGLVTAVDADTALVRIDGRTRTAMTLLTPDVRPGDWVLVGAGAIVRRLDAQQAALMQTAVDTASTPPTTTIPQGTPRHERQGDQP
jgi:hydrogenase maturation factor